MYSLAETGYIGKVGVVSTIICKNILSCTYTIIISTTLEWGTSNSLTNVHTKLNLQNSGCRGAMDVVHPLQIEKLLSFS